MYKMYKMKKKIPQEFQIAEENLEFAEGIFC